MLTFLFIMGMTTASAEIALSAVLGVVGTFITQFIKRVAGTNGNLALGLTVVISVVLGFISAFSVGQWNGADVIGSSAVVFSLATIAYRTLLSNDAVTTAPDNAVDTAANKVDGV